MKERRKADPLVSGIPSMMNLPAPTRVHLRASPCCAYFEEMKEEKKGTEELNTPLFELPLEMRFMSLPSVFDGSVRDGELNLAKVPWDKPQ